MTLAALHLSHVSVPMGSSTHGWVSALRLHGVHPAPARDRAEAPPAAAAYAWIFSTALSATAGTTMGLGT